MGGLMTTMADKAKFNWVGVAVIRTRLRRAVRDTLLVLAERLSTPQTWYDSLVDGEQSIAVRCPYCSREEGQPCKRSRPGKRTHLERRLAALNLLESHK